MIQEALNPDRLFYRQLLELWFGAQLLTAKEVEATALMAGLIIKELKPKHIYQFATGSFNQAELNTEAFTLEAKETLAHMLLTGTPNYLELVRSNILGASPQTNIEVKLREHEIWVFNTNLPILKQLFRSPLVSEIPTTHAT